MCSKEPDKVLSDPNTKSCSVCETYRRKIDDVEHSLSGRDQIISILQGRLKKCETNYKNLFDEFENLRFDHCTAMQDNYSLKEINAKLEEFDLKNQGTSLKCCGSHPNRSINCNNFDNKRNYQENNPDFQEVSHIETLVCKQNQVLKQLLDKIIKELKTCKCECPDNSKNFDKIKEDFKSVESGDHLNPDLKLHELSTQVESLKALLVTCQGENDCMKKLLQDRKNNFSECHNILQHTSRSINKISNSIDDLVKIKSVMKKSQETSCCMQDPAATSFNTEKENYERRISELEQETKEKEKEYDICKCQMIGQMNEIVDNNQLLSETLEIIKMENKTNLEAVAKLKDELKKANEDCEIKQREMKDRISQLENDLEEHYVKEQQLRSSLEESDNEKNELKEKLDNCIDENNKMKEQIGDLEDTCGEMQKDLDEKSLELNEYEEENRALKQNIECLMNCNIRLKKKINELENDSSQKYNEGEQAFKGQRGRCGDFGQLQKLQEIDRLNNIVQKQEEEIQKLTKEIAELSLGDQEKKSARFEEEGRCSSDGCRQGQNQQELERLNNIVRIHKEEIEKLTKENDELRNEQDNEIGTSELGQDGFCGQRQKLMEVEHLSSTVNFQKEEMDYLTKENANLRFQIELLKNENQKETEKLQGIVNHSQRQVEMLLKEHDEKTAQIQCVANELDGIRRSVTEENNTYLVTIDDLKLERDKLKEQLEKAKNDSYCKCDKNAMEVERLKSEICKKQCVILELEKSIDTFNYTMRQFEQNIESLASENVTLKEEKDKQLKDLENVQNKLKEKMSEVGELRDQLENAKRTCEISRSLENENEKLKNEVNKLKKDYEITMRSLETEKLGLQMEMAGLKGEHCPSSDIYGKLENTQKAYEDLQNQFASTTFDIKKLQEDLQNKNQIIEDLKAKVENIQGECEKLKNKNLANIEEQYKTGQKMANLQECCERMTKEYTAKCLENYDLAAKVNDHRQDNGQCCNDSDDFKKKLADNEKELAQSTEKCLCLQKNYDQKCQDFKKLKKLYDSCCKQSQISREEYTNLRIEYKEIKKMLADQIKKYRKETGNVECCQSGQDKQCQVVSDLRRQVLEKEKQILGLQQKLRDSSYEIIELKDYIHKLISDNNILKSAINNLIGNLERKIKGPNTADALAGEILQSLTNIESTIIKKSTNPYCPSDCTSKDCDCMLQIQSYKHNQEPSCVALYRSNATGRSCSAYRNTSPANTDDSRVELTYKKDIGCDLCTQGPSTKFKSNNQTSVGGCMDHIRSHANCCTTTMSQPATNIIISDQSSSTESEDCPCNTSFLDKESEDVLKETIMQELKTCKDNTMNEKSCDC